MRALTINEVQKFKRGMNPKAAMGIGGVTLCDTINKRREDLKKKLEDINNDADEENQKWLRKMFVGKTITAHMQSLVSFNINTKERTGKQEQGKFTIEVQDVMMDKLENHSIIFADMNNKIYSFSLNHIDPDKNIIYID
jgi:hypothetical protein